MQWHRDIVAPGALCYSCYPAVSRTEVYPSPKHATSCGKPVFSASPACILQIDTEEIPTFVSKDLDLNFWLRHFPVGHGGEITEVAFVSLSFLT